MALDGKAMAAIGVGTLFVWSGIKGWSILGTVGNLVTGSKPSQSVANELVVPGTQSFGSNPGGVAGTALEYQGHAYSFGGAPGKDGSKPWDCSSFVNFVVGVRLGLAIPGYGPGKYNGSSHGPPTGTWAVWSGLSRIGRSEVSAGDIVVWFGHMGIAISNTEMISAQNPKDGTKVSGIDGFGTGPVLTYGRLK